MRPRLLAGIPVGRFGDPGEVWLALRIVLECGFFTGRVLEIDRGRTDVSARPRSPGRPWIQGRRGSLALRTARVPWRAIIPGP